MWHYNASGLYAKFTMEVIITSTSVRTGTHISMTGTIMMSTIAATTPAASDATATMQNTYICNTEAKVMYRYWSWLCVRL